MIQYNNFLMKREQSRAGSRFAECEKSRLKAKILITLALLLTAASGAWAKTDPNAVYWTNETWAGWAENVTTHTVGDITITCSGNAKAYEWAGSGEPLALQAGANDAITFTSNGKPFASIKIQVDTNSDPGIAGWTWVSSEWTIEWSGTPSTSVTLSGCDIKADVITFTFGTAEPPIEVTPGSSANTWTFSMPGSDVVLTPQYAPAAQLAEGGAPAAVSGLEIAADAPIITAGQSAQGTLLYAVGTSQTEKPALTAFAATLPNAKDQTAAGNYYVWYYIQGQDTPQGQEPTADNTFNDSEIMGPVTVELLTNEHTLNIKQSPNITVTVAGTAVTPTDDKVTPVTTGQEVKIKAASGYKFRKVEVKKGAGDAGKSLAEATVGMIIGSNGKAYAADDKDNLPEGVTVAAKVCYVDGNGHGLALALADEVEEMNWSTAQTTCAAHTPAITGGTWKLASKDEWSNMITAAGSHTALRDGFSSVGGTNMQSDFYWSSTTISYGAWYYTFDGGSWSNGGKAATQYVRACLAF